VENTAMPKFERESEKDFIDETPRSKPEHQFEEALRPTFLFSSREYD